jgi:hypothetical protein
MQLEKIEAIKGALVKAFQDAYFFSVGSQYGMFGMSKPISFHEAYRLTLKVEMEKLKENVT